MAPLCICNGVIRSGSTWSFNVCRELFGLEAQRNNEKMGSAYLDSQPLEQFVTRQWGGVPGRTVIKAHTLGMNAMAVVRKGQAKAVCTYRDPRDCVASDLQFMNYPVEICLHRVSSTMSPIRVYQSAPQHFLLVRYEDMMEDTRREIRRVADHLQIAVDDAAVEMIDAKTNMDASRQLCENIRKKPSGRVTQVATHLVDSETHLHENHINGGTMGRWRFELSNEQALFATEHFAPWLIQLGYETPASLQALLNELNVAREMGPAAAAPQQGRPGTFEVGAMSSPRFA